MKYKQIIKDCACEGCPAIYEQKTDYCAASACPSIHESKQNESESNNYVVIGKIVNEKELEETGLNKKISKDETAVKIPKELINDLVKKLKTE